MRRGRKKEGSIRETRRREGERRGEGRKRGGGGGLTLHILKLQTNDLNRPNGVTFQIEKENCHIEPNKGDIVTLEYESYSRKSAPVNPSVVRVRTDLRWEDVVAEFVIASHVNGK